ncbi:MAG: pyruvate, phosphate dikinase [Planctomycetes bacterium]|nr:pyruvate, phosphate dikinase [Planctomycetota bacterium]
MTASLTLDWNAAFSAGPRLAGGKGWNLGRLARYGFPVPEGFVLSADAHRRFMQAPLFRRLAAEFAQVGAGEAASEEITARLSMLRRTIEAAALPPDVIDALRQSLGVTGLDRGAFAVRSSATAEDGGSTSFAGVHGSVLDVRGADAALRAVREVYASLWTPQALAYRRRFLVPDDDVACAVVVCRMVEAKSAGVAFTCDPRTGRRDAITISAARGKGEAVVSGSVNPEEITVALSHLGLNLESRSGPPVLDDAQALVLARLALRTLYALGDGQDPQDLEWVWDGARFWLLQARPVTRLPRVTFAGAEHLPTVWSNANIKDAIPFVMTPLTWSCVLSALRFMLWSYPAKIGYPVPRGTEVCRRFSGRGYFDVTSLQWAFYDCFGSPPAESNRGMGGHHAAIPVPAGHPLSGKKGLQRIWRLVKAVRLLLKLPKIVPPAIQKVFTQSREVNAIDLAPLTKAQLLELLIRISLLQVEFGEPFMFTASALAWQSELEKLLEKLIPGRGIAVACALVADTGNVVSAQQGTRLFDVADAARADEAALAWLKHEPFDMAGLQSLPELSPFRRELRRFLADFGHRAVYEAEVATPRWNEDPSWLLEQVRSILDGHGRRPDETARARREAAEREVREFTFFRRPQVNWLVKRAGEGAALRERAKSALIAQIEPLRRTLLEVGRRLVAAKVLAAPGDIFYLSWPDGEAWLRGEWDGRGAAALVADRKAQMAKWEKERPADAIAADGVAVAAPRVAPHPASVDGRTLKGMAVSSGLASGVARVIRHPAEGARLKQGEVLVAPSTDPGWTPLFLRASAVVMEVGGMLSHGAIVAREYGLPAVVNVPGLLDRVKDGQTLDVDGDRGVVTLR